MTLSSRAETELNWWINNIDSALSLFCLTIPQLLLRLMPQPQDGVLFWQIVEPVAHGPNMKVAAIIIV